MLLKLGSFQLLFQDSVLCAQRLGLERSERNNIQKSITKMHVLCFIYNILWFYTDWICCIVQIDQKIIKFTTTHYSEKCFNLKIQNKLIVFNVYNENQIKKFK